MTIAEWKEEGADWRIKIEQDQDPISPREWDNFGTFAGWHRRYIIGDVQPREEPEDYLEGLEEGTIVLPVFMYEHSGVCYSTEPFSCPWDSGQVGYIYCTPGKMKKECMDEEAVRRCMKAEIEVYSQWASGDVWGFIVEKRERCETCEHAEWEEQDSVWGFFGDDPLVNGMADYWDKEWVERVKAA